MRLDTITKVTSFMEENNMIEAGDSVVAGISGGADSVCLLFLLCAFRKELGLNLHVIHVNHGIREEAGDDEEFVRKLCERLEVPFEAIHCNIPALSQEWMCSEEEAGRRVRYEAFENLANKISKVPDKKVKIAVAHNLGDDAETILFHLFRGSGLHGMTGIPPVRKLGNALIVRPLLCLSRKEIEDYLISNEIEWVTDKTNNEDVYSRNRIRHTIIPAAEGICEGASEHIAKTASQLREIDELVEGLAQDCMKASLLGFSSDGCISLSVSKLSAYHIAVKKRALHTALKMITGGGRDVGSLQIEQLLELSEKEGNAQLDLARGVTAIKEYDKLVLLRKNIAADFESASETGIKNHVSMEIVSSESIAGGIAALMESVGKDSEVNKYTKWLDYDKIDGQIEIRCRRPGDYIVVALGDGNFGKKDIKKYMIDQKIPASQRDCLTMVAAADKCLWLVGYRISDDCRITTGTKKILKLSIE